MRKRLFALLLTLVLILALAACGGGDTTTTPPPGGNSTPQNSPGATSNPSSPASPASPAKPTEITVALSQLPNGLDPLLEDTPNALNIVLTYCDRLIAFDADNNMVPAIAKSWTKLDSLTWELEIDLDNVFHNGEPLTMDDVVFSLERIKTIPKAADAGRKIGEVSYTGNKLTLKLSDDSTAALSMVLTQSYIVNKAYVEAGGDEAIYLKPIGTGPYYLTEFTPGTSVTVEKWADYPFAQPAIDKINYIPIPESSARYIAVETGQAQFAYMLSSFEMALAEKNKDLTTVIKSNIRAFPIVINCEKPPFDNVNVRKALAYAFDREAYCSILGFRTPIKSVIFPGWEGIYVEPTNLPEFNLQRAKELLEAEGFNAANPLVFELMYQPNTRDPGIEIYQSALKSIGVEMQLNLVELSVFLQRESAGDFDIEIANYTNRASNPITDLDRVDWNLLGSRNTSRFYNERVMELIALMRTTTDNTELRRLNVELNEILGENVPMIPIMIIETLAVMDNKLTGVTINPAMFVNLRTGVYAG